jgi:hypothetical protein
LVAGLLDLTFSAAARPTDSHKAYCCAEGRAQAIDVSR